MKIKDFEEGQQVNHPRKGIGFVQKLTVRTITIKYKFSITKLTLGNKDVSFNMSDL